MTTSLLGLLLACGTTTPSDAPTPVEDETPASGPQDVAVGDYTFRLHPSADQVRIEVLDSSGAPIPAEGEVQVVLTGTGEDPQRIRLQPSGTSWTGPAKATGAPGYVAMISVPIDGRPQAARLTWGNVR